MNGKKITTAPGNENKKMIITDSSNLISKEDNKMSRKILPNGTGTIVESKTARMARPSAQMQSNSYRAPSQQFIQYLQKWRFDALNKDLSSRTATHMSMCQPFGKFAIPQTEMEEFFTRYEREIEKGSTLGIVERPLPHKELPVVIDVDLKYQLDDHTIDPSGIIDLRKHNFSTIKQVLSIYNEVYNKHFVFRDPNDKSSAFWVVTQRPEPYIVEQDGKKYVKDGWHAINPMLRAFPSVHLKMREEVLKDNRLRRIIAALGTIGTAEEVLDEAVINRNGWLLYGSTKPRREPYEYAYIFDMDLRERPREHLGAVSLPRYLSYWRVTTRHATACPQLIQRVLEEGKFHIEDETSNEKDDSSPDVADDIPIENKSFEHPESKESKKNTKVVQKEEKESKKEKKNKKKKKIQTVEVIDAVNPNNAEGGATKKIRALIDLLCERRAQVRSLWLEIGACLKAMAKTEEEEDKYMDIWIGFSEKYGHFSNNDCADAWAQLDVEKAADLPTLKYWASKDDPKGWKSFKRNEIRQFLTLCLNITHVDVAQTLYLLYESRYVFTDPKNNTWYEFRQGRWGEAKAGMSLRKRISNELAQEYARYRRFCLQMAEYVDSDELPESLEYDVTQDILDDIAMSSEEWLSNVEICEDLITKLKMKGYKDQILAEAKELFYDSHFEEKLDERHELIGFKNGVLDLDKRVFREGRPDDFITFSTKTTYTPNYKNAREYREIMEFLKQIYLTDEMVHYALKERAQMLHGDNTEERIFCWIGAGGNGKSKFKELNIKSFGDYADGFPITLFTGRRAQSSAPSPEVIRSKGKRMMFSDEPEENQRLNMGFTKQLSGGDNIQSRGLYKDTIEFLPQFGLTFLCNDPPKVPPHDEGTIRRLTCVPHDARFVKNPKKPNEFKRDMHLSRKIVRWIDIYSSMLIDYYYIYQEEGLDPPEQVTKFTEQFLRECDAYNEFISDVLVEIEEKNEENSFISLQALYGSFKYWVEDNGIFQRKPMSFKDFKTYLSKKIRRNGLIKASRLYGYRMKNTREMAASNTAPTY